MSKFTTLLTMVGTSGTGVALTTEAQQAVIDTATTLTVADVSMLGGLIVNAIAIIVQIIQFITKKKQV